MFLYSLVIEAGVGVAVKVKEVYGILSAQSNSLRAFLRMVNRCRNVEEPRVGFLKGDGLDIKNNYSTPRYWNGTARGSKKAP